MEKDFSVNFMGRQKLFAENRNLAMSISVIQQETYLLRPSIWYVPTDVTAQWPLTLRI